MRFAGAFRGRRGALAWLYVQTGAERKLSPRTRNEALSPLIRSPARGNPPTPSRNLGPPQGPRRRARSRTVVGSQARHSEFCKHSKRAISLHCSRSRSSANPNALSPRRSGLGPGRSYRPVGMVVSLRRKPWFIRVKFQASHTNLVVPPKTLLI
jgi:hypothetical protein